MAANDSFVRQMKEHRYTPTLTEKQILFYRSHPVKAAYDLLGVRLIWLQRITLNAIWFLRFPLLNMGRGVGKSWLIAIAAVLFGMLYPRNKIGIVAPVFRQANYVFDAIDELYSGSEYLQAATTKAPSRGSAQSILKFHNGSFIEALPVGDGTKIRGRRYYLCFIDEYAQMDEGIIKLVIRPMLNIKRAGRENKLIVASTAYYKWNHFWTLYLFYMRQIQLKNPHYFIAEFDYIDVQNTPNSPYQIDNEIIEMQKNDMTEEEFEMENRAKFPSDSVGFISAKLIDQCTPKLDPLEPENAQAENVYNSKYVLGIDAARVAGGDNFAIVLLKLSENKKIVSRVATLNGKTFQEMIDLIHSFLLRFDIIRIHLGGGGGGLTIKDLLAESWVGDNNQILPPILDMEDPNHINKDGLHILKVINESAKKNNELYMNMKADLQHKRLLFPVDVKATNREDRWLIDAYKENLALKRELMVLEAIPQGLYHKFTVPAKYRKDRATALVMAVDASIDLKHIDKMETAGELPVGFFL